MATENDDSRSMNGILSNISRDVVDTSWDIPPLTFPKLQPTDSEGNRWCGWGFAC